MLVHGGRDSALSAKRSPMQDNWTHTGKQSHSKYIVIQTDAASWTHVTKLTAFLYMGSSPYVGLILYVGSIWCMGDLLAQSPQPYTYIPYVSLCGSPPLPCTYIPCVSLHVFQFPAWFPAFTACPSSHLCVILTQPDILNYFLYFQAPVVWRPDSIFGPIFLYFFLLLHCIFELNKIAWFRQSACLFWEFCHNSGTWYL